MFGEILSGHHGDVIGSENVIGDRLKTVFLHHRHVLIGGSMKDSSWPVLSKSVAQKADIQYVADDWDEGNLREPAGQPHRYLEQVVLGAIQEN